MQFYIDPSRESDPYALPNAETFYVSAKDARKPDQLSTLEPGWYWWACFPGCLPDGEPSGPFDTEEEAIADARSLND